MGPKAPSRVRIPPSPFYGVVYNNGNHLSLGMEIYHAPVAQLDRVSGYEPGGREFESLRARKINKSIRYHPSLMESFRDTKKFSSIHLKTQLGD